MKLYYFGTNTREAGHYFWEIESDRMTRIGLSFPGLPGVAWEDFPFDPYELLTKEEKYQRGYSNFFTRGEYTIYAIGGSPIDKRRGCVSVFFVRANIEGSELLKLITSCKPAHEIFLSF